MNRRVSFAAVVGMILASRGRAICIATIFVSLQCAFWAQAESIVVPGAYATTEGYYALNRANIPPSRFQQLNEASEFSSLGGPVLITGYMARPHTLQTGPAAVSVTNLDFWISTTSRTVSTLSSVFADNRGADHTLVASYGSTYVFTTEDLPGPGNTRQFDVVHMFDTPFRYDPVAGNLLIEGRVEGDTLISGSEFYTSACSTGASCRTRMVISNSSADATSGQLQALGEINLFLYEPIAAADFDQDGDVDSADLALWQGGYGLNAEGDADNDGDTDGKDYLVWQRQYIAGVPGLAKELGIPEPASIALLAMCGITIVLRRRW